MRPMFGGPGHTSFEVSKLAGILGPCATVACLAAGAGFFLSLAESETGASSAHVSRIAKPRVTLLLFEFWRNVSISLLSFTDIYCITFMLLRFLWQLSQNTMLFSWSFTSIPGFAEECDWWQVMQLICARTLVMLV